MNEVIEASNVGKNNNENTSDNLVDLLPLEKNTEDGQTVFLTINNNYCKDSKRVGYCIGCERPNGCSAGVMPAYLTKKQVEHNNCIDCPNLQVFYERKYWRTVNVSLYEKPLRTIDGSFCKESQKVGYCKCDLHRGFLTKNLMEEHDCLGKECIWFVKDEDAPYWQYKAKKKEARKTGKALKKEIATKEKYYLEKMRELTREDSDFYIVNVEWNEKEKQYDVRVITFAFIESVQKFIPILVTKNIKYA